MFSMFKQTPRAFLSFLDSGRNKQEPSESDSPKSGNIVTSLLSSLSSLLFILQLYHSWFRNSHKQHLCLARQTSCLGLCARFPRCKKDLQKGHPSWSHQQLKTPATEPQKYGVYSPASSTASWFNRDPLSQNLSLIWSNFRVLVLYKDCFLVHWIPPWERPHHHKAPELPDPRAHCCASCLDEGDQCRTQLQVG